MPGKPKNFYDFEGQRLTLREVCSIVTGMGEDAIRAGLQRGCKTRRELLSYNLPAAKKRAGRMGGPSHWRASYPSRSF